MDEKRTAWERLQLVHTKGRPTIKDYIPQIFTDFYEMHGDRLCGDDKAILGGIGRLDGRPVTIIAQVKGRDINENKACNFAMPHPEGYRKALRLARQAEKFHRPVICFIDTPGAFCGVAAEERGQGEAIAKNIAEFMTLRTPIISIVLGEGGSGGALALSHADRIWMLEDAYFSVVSPESCANILWKSTEKADVAAAALGLTADKLYKLGLIDKVVRSVDMEKLTGEIAGQLRELLGVPAGELVMKRYRKFRKVGY